MTRLDESPIVVVEDNDVDDSSSDDQNNHNAILEYSISIKDEIIFPVLLPSSSAQTDAGTKIDRDDDNDTDHEL